MNGNTKYAFVTYFYLYLYRADWVHKSIILLQKFFETLATRYWFVGAGDIDSWVLVSDFGLRQWSASSPDLW